MTAPAPTPRPGAAVVRALEGRTSPTQPPPPPPGGPRPGERALRLLTVAVVALSAALLTGRAWLLALAAAPLVLLALALPRAYARRVETSAAVEPRRCFEGDTVTLRISVAHDGGAIRLDPGVTLGPGLRLDEVAVGASTVTLRHTALLWGRWSLGPVDLDVYDAGAPCAVPCGSRRPRCRCSRAPLRRGSRRFRRGCRSGSANTPPYRPERASRSSGWGRGCPGKGSGASTGRRRPGAARCSCTGSRPSVPPTR
ncbi:hypothetical protein ACQPXT_02260 [Streptomyces sp. CA-100214]